MRHATVQALDTIRPTRGHPLPWRKACDPSGFAEGESFDSVEAIQLINGVGGVLPDCPRCSVLLDEALRLAGLTGGENVEATVSP